LSFSEFIELWSDELLDAEDDELMFQRAFQFFDKDGMDLEFKV
jgi:Ca2+-binding EF-hand superfamily protein